MGKINPITFVFLEKDTYIALMCGDQESLLVRITPYRYLQGVTSS